MNLQEAIAAAKAKNHLTSDRALAKLIGVSDVTILSWRHGTHGPKPEHAHRLALLAAIDPAPFVADMLIEGTKDAELKTTLERLKRAVAALFLVALTLPALPAENAPQTATAPDNCILC